MASKHSPTTVIRSNIGGMDGETGRFHTKPHLLRTVD